MFWLQYSPPPFHIDVTLENSAQKSELNIIMKYRRHSNLRGHTIFRDIQPMSIIKTVKPVKPRTTANKQTWGLIKNPKGWTTNQPETLNVKTAVPPASAAVAATVAVTHRIQ